MSDLEAVFLPLMDHGHDTNNTHRTLGLAMVPVKGTGTKYERIGRAAVTYDMWLWNSCKLSVMEIELE